MPDPRDNVRGELDITGDRLEFTELLVVRNRAPLGLGAGVVVLVEPDVTDEQLAGILDRAAELTHARIEGACG